MIGSGLSDLVLALRLKRAGIPVTVIEKNPGAGGTWHENRYPGCRVDVASHSYSFSFTQDYRWPTLFSPASELQRDFDAFVERFELRDIIRFETEVVRADYDEDAHEWAVRLRDASGAESTERTCSLISAVGQFNRARIPQLEGLDSFAGRHWHTSGWPGDVDLAGKRVVVGAAATGVQAIPRIAAVAAHTTVMMRSPNWLTLPADYEPGEERRNRTIASRTGRTPAEVFYDLLAWGDGNHMAADYVMNYPAAISARSTTCSPSPAR